MKQLSVIIAFLNEGVEIERTLKGIRQTSGNNVDIILINDASSDGFDYKTVSENYNVTYILNEKRLGCSVSRDIGVMHCKTPYFLIIDGHMRFYLNNWHIEIINALEGDTRALYCCRCKVWYHNTNEESNVDPHYASFLRFFDPEKRNILDVEWIKKDIFPDEEIVDIPCVLGACYAAEKKYWQYLKGFQGLKLYSCDEQYISMKVWMEGGRCRLLKNIQIGHLFREVFPYEVKMEEFFYNKLVIIETLLPDEMKNAMIKKLKAMNYAEYIRSMKMFTENIIKIKELKEYYKNIFKTDFEHFYKLNDAVIDKYINQ